MIANTTLSCSEGWSQSSGTFNFQRRQHHKGNGGPTSSLAHWKPLKQSFHNKSRLGSIYTKSVYCGLFRIKCYQGSKPNKSTYQFLKKLTFWFVGLRHGVTFNRSETTEYKSVLREQRKRTSVHCHPFPPIADWARIALPDNGTSKGNAAGWLNM